MKARKKPKFDQRLIIFPPPQASGEGVTVVQNSTAGLKK